MAQEAPFKSGYVPLRVGSVKRFVPKLSIWDFTDASLKLTLRRWAGTAADAHRNACNGACVWGGGVLHQQSGAALSIIMLRVHAPKPTQAHRSPTPNCRFGGVFNLPAFDPLKNIPLKVLADWGVKSGTGCTITLTNRGWFELDCSKLKLVMQTLKYSTAAGGTPTGGDYDIQLKVTLKVKDGVTVTGSKFIESVFKLNAWGAAHRGGARCQQAAFPRHCWGGGLRETCCALNSLQLGPSVVISTGGTPIRCCCRCLCVHAPNTRCLNNQSSPPSARLLANASSSKRQHCDLASINIWLGWIWDHKHACWMAWSDSVDQLRSTLKPCKPHPRNKRARSYCFDILLPTLRRGHCFLFSQTTVHSDVAPHISWIAAAQDVTPTSVSAPLQSTACSLSYTKAAVGTSVHVRDSQRRVRRREVNRRAKLQLFPSREIVPRDTRRRVLDHSRWLCAMIHESWRRSGSKAQERARRSTAYPRRW